MLSKIPVIATKTGMMATYLGKYASLISGHDVNELSEKMIQAQSGELNVCTNKAELAVREFISQLDSRKEWREVINKKMREIYAQQSHTRGQQKAPLGPRSAFCCR